MTLDVVALSVSVITFLVSIFIIGSVFLALKFLVKHPSLSWKIKLPATASQIFGVIECATLCTGLILFQIKGNNAQTVILYFIIAVFIHTIPQLGATIIILVRLYYLPNKSIAKQTFIVIMVFAIIVCLWMYEILVNALLLLDDMINLKKMTLYLHLQWIVLHSLSIPFYLTLITILNKRLYPLIMDKNERLKTYDTDRYQHTCSTTIINGILYSIKCIQISITLFISNIIYSFLFILILTISIIMYDNDNILAPDTLYILYILLILNLMVHSIYILYDLYRNNGVDPYNKMLCFSCIYTRCCESGMNWYIMNKAYNNSYATENMALDAKDTKPQIKAVLNDDAYGINILCFGDSLTSGYCNDGREYHPYSNQLKKLIKEKLIEDGKGDSQINIVESGKFDECVTKSMYHRLEDILNSNKFGIVIFLGGANDIGYNVEVQQICNELERIYKLILEHNGSACKLIAVSIPGRLDEIVKDSETTFTPKSEVNKFIFRYCSGNDNNVSFCDLYDHFNTMDDKQKRQMYDMDQLHFSVKGYNELASVLLPFVMNLA